MAPRRRLDLELVRRGLAPSREAAPRLITEGQVVVGGAPAAKAARQVSPGEDVRVLALHFRDDADGAAFIREQGYDFAVIADADAIAERYGIHGTPGVVIPDQDLAIRFDLRTLPRRPAPGGEDQPHSTKAAFRAPYWAAEIRRALDGLDEG